MKSALYKIYKIGLLNISSVKRKSKDGDRLIIDFEGLLDGESFEGGAAEGFEIVLGKGAMIEGF